MIQRILLALCCLSFGAAVVAQAAEPDQPAPSAEVRTRQALIQVALGKAPADLLIHGATVLNVFTGEWLENQDIVIAGERIAWLGPAGAWTGKAARTHDARGLWAVPGFGESHKHIESTYLTPEYEAELVIPFGNTWTVEGSHEISNVIGLNNVDYWLRAERAGSPLKIFPAIGSATPPTVYERGGGFYGYHEMAGFLQADPRVVGLGEVMDWPALHRPGAPGSARLWGMIQATWDQRGVVEGHGSGLSTLPLVNAFAAAGLSSDHEAREGEEGLMKLRRGVFLEMRPDTTRVVVPRLLEAGIRDWSNVSVTTDDRDVSATRQLGSMDYNIRTAIQAGVPPANAYAMGSYNTARHFHIDHLVGAIAPGRYADVVLLEDPDAVKIKEVFANGTLAARNGGYLLEVPQVTYPQWAHATVKVGRVLSAGDFRIDAPPGRPTVSAALMEPFMFTDEFIEALLPVTDGEVRADPANGIIKVAMVDRHSGSGAVSKMFWRGVGPVTPGSALASSQSHDLHNIWVIGNDDAAMAAAVNAVAERHGGWALVRGGEVVATVTLEIAGLVSQRPAAVVAAEVEALHAAADAMTWIRNPGLPERMRFAFLTASPWQWQLVAPYQGNAGGFVNVATGETHPVIW